MIWLVVFLMLLGGLVFGVVASAIDDAGEVGASQVVMVAAWLLSATAGFVVCIEVLS